MRGEGADAQPAVDAVPGERDIAMRASRSKNSTRSRNGPGMRFSHDRMAAAERFVTLRTQLGGAFEVIELRAGSGNAGGICAQRALGAHPGPATGPAELGVPRPAPGPWSSSGNI